jgi:hypothetical protein
MEGFQVKKIIQPGMRQQSRFAPADTCIPVSNAGANLMLLLIRLNVSNVCKTFFVLVFTFF